VNLKTNQPEVASGILVYDIVSFINI